MTKGIRMDYPSDKARYLDDQFHKGGLDFVVREISLSKKRITFYEGSGTLEREFKVSLEFCWASSPTRKETRTLKVKWSKSLNGNYESWKHSMSCTDVPTIWEQVRHDVVHDAKILENITTTKTLNRTQDATRCVQERN
jgi:hypothetical protein